MDSLTHLAIGALIGEMCAGRAMGKRAMAVGAIYQSIPDIDFIGSLFLSPTENILFHRGFTHSFLFGILITLLISFWADKWRKLKEFSFKKWTLFIGLEIFIHLIVDSLNSYGVGWFEPFSHHRVAFDVIFVIDPLFSVWLGISCAALLILRRSSQHRITWALGGLLASLVYLCVCMANKAAINRTLENSLNGKSLPYQRYFTTPTALNNLLWYCVVESDSGYYIGYRSVFDQSAAIPFQYFPRNQRLLKNIKEKPEVRRLVQFSNGYYTAEKVDDGMLFNDLRFGRIAGWENNPTRFTFHYYLEQPAKNRLVVQRGRFAEWNWETIQSLLNRIRGNY